MPHKDPAKRREYIRQWKARKKSTGLCIYCPNAARPGLGTCQKCYEYYRDYRQAHPEDSLAAVKKYQERNLLNGCCATCGSSELHTKWHCKDCNDKMKERSRLDYLKQKRTVLDHYGHACEMCGEGTEEFLTVDHVEKWIKGTPRGGVFLLRWLVRDGFPDGFQILCWNCNSGRKPNRKCSTLKLDMMDHYGGRACVCCGEDDTRCLTIDHIAGDGAKHRKEAGIASGSATYNWLKANAYPAGYQVLCYNCNGAKGHNRRCPHEKNLTD